MKLPRWLRWRSRQELDEEVAAHLELATQAGIERGLTPEEGRYAALREMGNVTRLRERAREGDPLFWIGSVAKDVRYALRSLKRNPGFTAAAILSLALGIGVNSAIFSLADGLLLRPQDVPHPGNLVRVHASTPQYAYGTLSYREYTTYRDQSRTFSGLAAENIHYLAVQDQDNRQARMFFGDLVSGNFLSVAEAQPALGRSFLPEEDSPGAKDIVAVLSDQCWQVKFHSDPHIVGSRIIVNGQPTTIIGVLPPWFRGVDGYLRPEIFIPLAATPRLFPSDQLLTNARVRYLQLYGRLKAGVSIRAAQAEFTTLSQRVEKAFPKADAQRTAIVLPELASRMEQQGDDLRLIYPLLAIAALVLLVACVNVANLLLGRASARAREMSIRQSVGASRGRLIAQLLTESAVLAAAGAGAGLLLSQAAIRFFASIQISSDLPADMRVRMDGRVLMYTLAAMVLAVIVSGLWPAIRGARVNLVSRATSADSSSGAWGRSALTVVQTALAVVLLIPALLFAKSYILAARSNPGFRIDNVLVMSFNPALAGYSEVRTREFYQQVEDRVNALPGVRSAALASHIPEGTDSQWARVAPEGKPIDSPGVFAAMFDRVEPGYFETMATPILEGRAIDSRDSPNAPLVAVVNQELARRFWPNGGAVGQRMVFENGAMPETVQVVGVAVNGKYQSTIDHPEPYLYVPYRQVTPPAMTLFVHTAGEPAVMAPAIREVVRAAGPDVPAFDMHTMREIFESHGLLASRMVAQIVGVTGAIGLALGVVGLYAVVAFTVMRRTREIGIRMALGATARSVLRGVLASGVKVTLAGVALGLAGAFALTRFFGEFLDQVNPRDPAAFAGVAILLVGVSLAACWAPARRAAKVDPAITLRYE